MSKASIRVLYIFNFSNIFIPSSCFLRLLCFFQSEQVSSHILQWPPLGRSKSCADHCFRDSRLSKQQFTIMQLCQPSCLRVFFQQLVLHASKFALLVSFLLNFNNPHLAAPSLQDFSAHFAPNPFPTFANSQP